MKRAAIFDKQEKSPVGGNAAGTACSERGKRVTFSWLGLNHTRLESAGASDQGGRNQTARPQGSKGTLLRLTCAAGETNWTRLRYGILVGLGDGGLETTVRTAGSKGTSSCGYKISTF